MNRLQLKPEIEEEDSASLAKLEKTRPNPRKKSSKPTAIRKFFGALIIFALIGGIKVLYSDSSETEPPADVKSAHPATLDARLTQCLLPKAQYGEYSSFDGGKSAFALIGECDVAVEWEENCVATGGTEHNCFTKIMILAQAAIKEFGK
ncbi:MAG TPA: hypothetical protein VGU46_07835 [Acidobacteriaceae bacterium]|nr:hypothetical protein [Acidobacteriaceae bacterium]